MIELGKYQILKVVRKSTIGVYLGDEREQVLLPKKQVPQDISVGDSIKVFIYRDSEDRLISTVNQPLLTLGEVAMLTVKDVSKNGAYLDWGLEKDLLLPFREQVRKVRPGEECLVALYLEKDLFLPYKEQTTQVRPGERYLIALYIDKSSRLCGTMNVYDYLEDNPPYVKDDQVSGIVYNYNERFGAFVAVDNKYHGMLLKRELHRNVQIGEQIEARVINVRKDGKMDLSLQKKAYLQMEDDAKKIYEIIEAMGGELPYTDKAKPEVIKNDFNMSKNEFKRGIGRLLKEHKVSIGVNSINLTKE